MLVNEDPKYKRPSVTTDAVVVAYNGENIKLILTKRPADDEYFADKLSLIGGFVKENKTFIDSCLDTIENKTNLEFKINNIYEQRAISYPDRDPRGWVVSIPYIIILNKELYDKVDKSTFTEIDVYYDKNGPYLKVKPSEFAFDHLQIILEVVKELQVSTDWSNMFLKLLPEEFTINDAYNLYKTINPNSSLVVNNFKRTYGKFIEEVNSKEKSKAAGRKARLFKLKLES